MEILSQARTRAHHDAEMAFRNAREWRETFTCDIVTRVTQNGSNRLRAARETCCSSNTRCAHRVGDVLRELLRTRCNSRAARRMVNELQSLNEYAFASCETLGVTARGFSPIEDENVGARK